MMIVWIVVVIFLLLAVRPYSETNNVEKSEAVENRATAILQERLVNGEISNREYLLMLNILKDGR